MKSDHTDKKCQRCYLTVAKKGEKFCATCKKIALKELRDAGYLTPRPWVEHRTSDQKENVMDTKNGRDW